MDITLCQIDPIYCRTLSHYNKTLEQRNALLRQLAEGQGSLDVLPIFTDKLVDLGSQIFGRRAEFLANLAREAQHIHYEALTEGKETIRLQLFTPVAGRMETAVTAIISTWKRPGNGCKPTKTTRQPLPPDLRKRWPMPNEPT